MMKSFEKEWSFGAKVLSYFNRNKHAIKWFNSISQHKKNLCRRRIKHHMNTLGGM